MKDKLVEIIKNIVKSANGEMSINRLKKRGMIVGENFSRQQGCFIDPSHCFLIKIGNNVTFSIRVVLLAHDASSNKLLGFTKFGKIIIEDNVFVGANVTILPNVKIGENSIIGSGSVVTKDIPKNCVAAGNPAKVISTIEEYKEKLNKIKSESNTFDKSYTISYNCSKEKINELIEISKNGIGFIE